MRDTFKKILNGNPTNIIQFFGYVLLLIVASITLQWIAPLITNPWFVTGTSILFNGIFALNTHMRQKNFDKLMNKFKLGDILFLILLLLAITEIGASLVTGKFLLAIAILGIPYITILVLFIFTK